MTWRHWLVVMAFFYGQATMADAIGLKFVVENQSKRDHLLMTLPPGTQRPQLFMKDPKTLRIELPRALTLPIPEDFKGKSRFIERMELTELDSKQGLQLYLYLKEPYLHIKEEYVGAEQDNPLLDLVIEKYTTPTAIGPTRLFEGMVLPGRDATLMHIVFSGYGWLEKEVDFGHGVLRIHWPEAHLGQAFNEIAPAGLIERVYTYGFNNGGVDMEVRLHPLADKVYFHRSADAGLLTIELRSKHDLGRSEEVKKIIEGRVEKHHQGQVAALSHLTPIFVNPPDKVLLNKAEYDEAYFFNKALEAEHNGQFAKARAFLDSQLQLFPDTPNRELIEFKKLALAEQLGWEPGWLLGELESLMSRFPNTAYYDKYRLLNLKLLNRVRQFENALGIITDPNLPKNSAEVLIELGRTNMGLERWNEAEKNLNDVFAIDVDNGTLTVEARYLQSQIARLSGDLQRSVAILDSFSDEQMDLVYDHANWLMDVADTYFQSGQFAKALNFYATFLNSYPEDVEQAPTALLQAGECRRHMGQRENALNLYDRLMTEFPNSPNTLWARVYRLQLQEDRPVEERLKELDAIINITPVTGAVVEAHFQKALLQSREVSKRSAMETMNHLLALSDREHIKERATDLKRQFLEEGMGVALEEGKPEYAILLAELFGADFRQDGHFHKARILLAEALARVGVHDQAIALLEGIEEWPAPELKDLSHALLQGALLKQDIGKGMQMYPGVARIRLDEAARLAARGEWENVLILLEKLSEQFLHEDERNLRLRMLAQAEEGRGRFPQAVANLEKLLFEKPVQNGLDHFWYATLLQRWKGDVKAIAAYERVAKEASDPEIKAFARLRLADIALQQGLVGDAARFYKEASRLVPNTIISSIAREASKQMEMKR